MDNPTDASDPLPDLDPDSSQPPNPEPEDEVSRPNDNNNNNNNNNNGIWNRNGRLDVDEREEEEGEERDEEEEVEEARERRTRLRVDGGESSDGNRLSSPVLRHVPPASVSARIDECADEEMYRIERIRPFRQRILRRRYAPDFDIHRVLPSHLLSSMQNQALGVTLHQMDEIPFFEYVYEPAIRVSVFDEDIGSLWSCADESFPGSVFDVISPQTTNPYSVRKKNSLSPSWNETLVFDVEILTSLHPRCILLFEVLDLFQSPKDKYLQKDAVTPFSPRIIAWGYLKLANPAGYVHVGKPLKIRLYEYSKSFGDGRLFYEVLKQRRSENLVDEGALVRHVEQLAQYRERARAGEIACCSNPFLNSCACCSDYGFDENDIGTPEILAQYCTTESRIPLPFSLFVSIVSKDTTLSMRRRRELLAARFRSDEGVERGDHVAEERVEDALGSSANIPVVEEPVVQIPIKKQLTEKKRLPSEPCFPPNACLGSFSSSPRGAMCSSLSHSGKLGCFPFVEGQSHGIALFDTRDLSIVDFHLGHVNVVYDLAFSNDDSVVASCSSDRTCILFTIDVSESERSNQTRNDRMLFLYHSSFVYACAFHPSGGMVATGSYDRIVRLWSSTTGVILREFDVFGSGHINALSFDSIGRRLYAGDSTGILCYWRLPREAIRELSAPDSSPMSQEIIHSIASSFVRAVCHRPVDMSGPYGISSLVMHPNGKLLIVLSKDNLIRAVTMDKFDVAQRYVGVASSQTRLVCCVSPDGQFIASPSEDGLLYLWRFETAERVTIDAVPVLSVPLWETVRGVRSLVSRFEQQKGVFPQQELLDLFTSMSAALNDRRSCLTSVSWSPNEHALLVSSLDPFEGVRLLYTDRVLSRLISRYSGSMIHGSIGWMTESASGGWDPGSSALLGLSGQSQRPTSSSSPRSSSPVGVQNSRNHNQSVTFSSLQRDDDDLQQKGDKKLAKKSIAERRSTTSQAQDSVVHSSSSAFSISAEETSDHRPSNQEKESRHVKPPTRDAAYERMLDHFYSVYSGKRPQAKKEEDTETPSTDPSSSSEKGKSKGWVRLSQVVREKTWKKSLFDLVKEASDETAQSRILPDPD